MKNLDALAVSFGRMHFRLHRLLDRRMTESGASLARTKLLMYIDEGGAVRATDIAEMFGQAPRTVTEALDGLERNGLVCREPDPNDRRVKLVTITGEGRRAIAAAEPLRLRMVDQFFGGLDAQEREQLSEIIAKISLAIDQAEDDDGILSPRCR